LQWNARPLWFAGAAIEYGPKKPFDRMDFFGTLELKVGIPGKTGVIEDRDWLVPVTVPSALTHFSSHDNITKAAVLADLGGGISVPLTGSLVLRLSLDLSYMHFKYEAHDGYTQYGGPTGNDHLPSSTNPYVPWDPAWPKDDPSRVRGLSMDYVQHWFILRPSAGLALRLNRFYLSASLSLSPLVAGFAADNHYRRNPPFLDQAGLSGGIFVEPKGGVSFAFNEQCKLGITVAYRYMSESRGDAEYYEYKPSGTVKTRYADIAGARYRAFYGTLALSYTF
jgi:outer membrane protease